MSLPDHTDSAIAVRRLAGAPTAVAAARTRRAPPPLRLLVSTQVLIPGTVGEYRLRWDQQLAAFDGAFVGSHVVVAHPSTLARRGSNRIGALAELVDTQHQKGRLQSVQLRGLERVRLRRVQRHDMQADALALPESCDLSPDDKRALTEAAQLNPAWSFPLPWAEQNWTERIDSVFAASGSFANDTVAPLPLLTTVSLTARVATLRAALPHLFPQSRPRHQPQPRDHQGEGAQADRADEPVLPEDIRQRIEEEEHASIWERPIDDTVRFLKALRWTAPPQQPLDLAVARRALDDSHAGLEEVKAAVLDVLAATTWRRLRGIDGGYSASSICLVGPAGVGKTTIAAAIAAASGRRLERINLAGADEVYLQGADRSYSRAEPGEIVMRLYRSRCHPSQLVFLLDEIDKVTPWDTRSAVPSLLCLLDPEQNGEWQDIYLSGIRIDLSQAWFIATANEAERIPTPLRDRLHIFQIAAYSRAEQTRIGRDHIAPRLLQALQAHDVITVTDDAITTLVQQGPPVAGMRGLDQRLRAAIARALREHLEQHRPVTIDRAWLDTRFRSQTATPRTMGFRPPRPRR